MISRREWLALVGKLGVIGAAASLGVSLPAHAVTRPSVTLDSLFLNVSPRPVISSRAAPRIVTNLITPNLKTYTKAAGWTQNAADGKYTWGGDVDGGQWVEFSAGAGEQVFTSIDIYLRKGMRYVLSLTVEAKTGTLNARNFQITSAAQTGTWNVSNPALGRHVLAFTATSSLLVSMRIGIGTDAANTLAATLRVSNIMIEMSADPARTYPYEYVQPGTQRAYAYTHTNTVATTLCGTPTLGTSYAIPRRSSVLVVGDSFSDTHDNATNFGSTSFGDFPFQMQRWLPQCAITTRGVAGKQIAEITALMTAAVTESIGAVGASPYTVCILQGGVNDMQVGSRTLAQMQADKLAQISACVAAGMYPVLVGLSAWDGFATWTAPFQVTTLAFNAWLKTLGYPMYDLYADSDDGTGTMKTSWGSSDGLHPSVGWTGGQSIMGRRLADLIQLIGD